jgi:(2Fe-2S) ferredoxin
VPHIQDIGAFSSIREAGMAKLVPNVPRIGVGMGTCGRGNGAEALFHAFSEQIRNSGASIILAPVGCFGACFEEPMVNVRLPGLPLLLLRNVQASDAPRILQD